MKKFSIAVITFYTIFFLLLGGALIALAGQLIPIGDITLFLENLYAVREMRIALGLVGGMLILCSLWIVKAAMETFQREKTIAFNNPDGQVIVSLAAIDDFIRRSARQLPEVKELKSDVIKTKRGIEIWSRVSFWSEVNIPEATEKIQSVIKTRIQEMLGVDEPVTVRVYVAKVVHREEEPKKPLEAIVPFRGLEYRND